MSYQCGFDLGDGDVIGPASSTDNAVARFDGTTGKTIQNSVVIIDDVGVTTGITQLDVDNLRIDGNTVSSTDTNGDINLTPDGSGQVVISSDATINSRIFGIGPGDSSNISLGGNILSGSTGADNVFAGNAAGQSLTTGTRNVIIGNNQGGSLTTGSNNVGIGRGSLGNATTGSANLCFGYNAGPAITTGSSNLCIGTFAGNSITTTNANVCIGPVSMANNASGASNVCIGNATAKNNPNGGVDITSGNFNIFIGAGASGDSAACSEVIAIGYQSTAPAATGATSGDDGAGIAIGSATAPVGFRGDETIYPSAGTSAGYWRVVINGTAYKILLMADS